MKLKTPRTASRSKRPTQPAWFTYIVQCADGTFYVGITTDLDRRLAMHSDGSASRYTRARRPVFLRYAEHQPSRSAATIREIELKRWRRAHKIALFGSAANLLRD